MENELPSALGPANEPAPEARWTLRAMGNRFVNGGGDRLAIWLSGLCVLHCIASGFILASMLSASTALLNPAFHEIGLVLAIMLGLAVLVTGARAHRSLTPFAVGSTGLIIMAYALTLPHDYREVTATIIGLCFVAMGHELNRRARRRAES